MSSTDQKGQGTVELGPDETARDGTCGACERFGRGQGGNGWGRCGLRLPPHAEMKKGDQEDWPDATHDTSTCSFYVSTQRQFKQMRYWTVPQNVHR